MKYLFGLFLLLSSFVLHGQHFYVSGRVVNTLDQPLGKTQISDGQKIITTTSDGRFLLTNQFLPNVITVKHQHYGEREIFVNQPPIGLDTVYITIVMNEKATELEEVTISSSRVIWAYPKAHVHVIDFDLYGEQMLLLCKDHNEYLIRLVNAYNEPLFDLPIPRHPKGFYRDCTKGIHILYNDSSFEIGVKNDSLKLIGFQTRKQLKERVEPCICSTGNLKIYEHVGSFRQTIDFVSVDTLSGKVSRMYYLSNRKYRRALEEYRKELAMQEKSVDNQMSSNTVDEQLAYQKKLELQKEYLSLLNRPVYAPVVRLRDSIVLFDHVNDTAIVYDKRGRQVRSFPIIYQYHKKWDHELIVNEEGTRLFARFDYRGMARLVEINPSNGEIIGEFRLEKHIYPGKIQVRGDFVYYIFHHYIDYSINYVYKQRLDSPAPQDSVIGN